MKNKLILSFLLFSFAFPIFANDWGILPDVKLDDTTNYSPYIIYKLVKGETVTYCIDGNGDEKKFENFEASALKALKFWFTYTADRIDFENRKEEFADIYPILRRELKLQKVNCSAALKNQSYVKLSNKPGYEYSDSIEDLRLMLLNDKSFNRYMGSSGGVQLRGEQGVRPSYVAIRESRTEDKNDLFYLLTHELGHMLGLSDQYLAAIDAADPAYGTSAVRASIMNYSKYLTCDDADGLINLIDCKVNHTKRGMPKGWVTFCPEKNVVYKNCNEASRDPFVTYSESPQSGKMRVTTYNQDGTIKSSETIVSKGARLKYSPFKVLLSGKIKQIKHNKDKQIVFIEDENGITTNISYFPDSLTQIVSRDPKNPDIRPAVSIMQLTPEKDKKNITIKSVDTGDHHKAVTFNLEDKDSYNGTIQTMGPNSKKALNYQKSKDGTMIIACLGPKSDYCQRGSPETVYYYEDNSGRSAACLIERRSRVYCMEGEDASLTRQSPLYPAIEEAVAVSKLSLDNLLEKGNNEEETDKEILSSYLGHIAKMRNYANTLFNIFDSDPVKNDEIKKELQKAFRKPKYITNPYVFD